MKKVLSVLVCALFVLCVSAQEGAHEKKVLLVDYFTYTSSIGNSYPMMLKNAIVGGIQVVGRLKVIDAESEASLKLEEDRRSSEAAMGDKKARTELIKKLGADYMMNIHITTMSAVRKKLEDGTIYYDGIINFTLSVTNVADGTILVSKPFSYKGFTGKTGDSPQSAVLATTDYIKISMNKFVNDNFKLESKIVAVEEVGRKGAETVYINCGSSAGIGKKQLFDVFKIKVVAGRELKTKIGVLEVVEVQGEDMALCKVKKGGKEIKECSDGAIEMPVLSGKKKVSLLESVGTVVK